MLIIQKIYINSSFFLKFVGFFGVADACKGGGVASKGVEPASKWRVASKRVKVANKCRVTSKSPKVANKSPKSANKLQSHPNPSAINNDFQNMKINLDIYIFKYIHYNENDNINNKN